MKAGIAQWIGSRAKQEDVYRVKFYPAGLLVLVADGGQGASCGELRSAGLINSFEATFSELADYPLVTEKLRQAFTSTAEVAESLSLLAVFISNGTISWICSGESPLLLWRRGELLHLNVRHAQGAYSLMPGDCILVASDGLLSLLTSGKVSDVLLTIPVELGGSPAVSLVQACREFAEENADNVTVVSVGWP